MKLEDEGKELEILKEEYLEFVEKHSHNSSRPYTSRKESRICKMCNKFTFDRRDSFYILKHDCCLVCYIKHKERG